MPSRFAFLFSQYLALILGAVTLGYSELDYLPEVTAFTGVVAVFMFVAFLRDLRGLSLSLEFANRMGFAIGILALVWIAIHYRNRDSLLNTLPWPAGMLPYIAPMLMILLPAKLGRTKHVGDWWALHAMCLCSVGLAVSLAEDIACVLLTLLYTAASVWALTLFNLWRTAGKITPYPAMGTARSDVITLAAAFEGIGPPSPAERLGRSHFVRSLRWLAVAAAIAVPVFFVTPRLSGVSWELFATKLETGYATDSQPDLSRTGQLKPSRDVAFEVIARMKSGAPYDLLPPDQHWRGTGYAEYQSPRGRWKKSTAPPIFKSNGPQGVYTSAQPEFPDFGNDALDLEFRIIGQTGGPLFASPVAFRIGERTPAAVRFRVGYNYAFQAWDTSLLLLPGRDSRFIDHYVQVIPKRNGERPVPLSTFALADGDESIVLAPFLHRPSEGIVNYAKTTLETLLSQGLIHPVVRTRWNPFTRQPHPDDHAAVATAFSDYFSNGDFGYSLDLRRQDRTIDPTEDFLRNTRQGHCERFATALVLMLRSLGIPAQFATGFRGLEPVGQGKYIIRQEDAHAWAEVLLSRAGGHGREWWWQTFDPTPAFSAPLVEGEVTIIDNGAQQGKRLLNDYIVGFTPETQARLKEDALGIIDQAWPWLAALAAVLAGGIALRAVLRINRRQTPGAATHHDDLKTYTVWNASLAPYGLARTQDETPIEHAHRVEAALIARGATAEIADTPLAIAQAVCHRRYALQQASIPAFEACVNWLRNSS